MPERVLVTGSRDYTDRAHVFRVLTELHATAGIECLIEGGQTGADTLARDWAKANLPESALETVPADWTKWGKSAGPRRNSLMLTFEPTLVVAFPGGKGTADMIEKATRKGIEIWQVTPASSDAATLETL